MRDVADAGAARRDQDRRKAQARDGGGERRSTDIRDMAHLDGLIRCECRASAGGR